MQLQEFVTESLLQIANGVSEAQRKIVGNAQINPRLPDHANVSSGHFTKIPKDMILLRDGEVVTMVQFDVAVTTTEGEHVVWSIVVTESDPRYTEDTGGTPDTADTGDTSGSNVGDRPDPPAPGCGCGAPSASAVPAGAALASGSTR